MILDNYYKLVGFFSGRYNDLTTNSTSPIGVVDDTGALISDVIYNSNNNQTYATHTNSNYNIRYDLSFRIGSGLVDPDIHDYTMTTDVTSSFSNFRSDITVACSVGKIMLTAILTGINTTNSPITISEIGLFKKLYCGSIASVEKYAMLIHHKLDSPIVVASGEGLDFPFQWIEE